MKRVLFFVFAVVLFCGILSCGDSSIQKIIKVTGGNVEGIQEEGITMFKGIPFAAPPVGDLRWKAPQPVVPWEDTLKADGYACGCIQDEGMAKAMGASTGTCEDCLFLNVWTPAKSTKENRAVIVWIHGGGFSGGMTSIPMYDGINFAKKGVVLVALTYRLGPFGFLAHPELSKESGNGSGNYGLMDMIAGLEWVKENIGKFGGDKNNVTIFGHSAGGMAVSMLAASPEAEGLFHKVISMSGGSFAPSRTLNESGQNVATLKLAESAGESFLEALGVKSIEEARSVDADRVFNAQKKMKMKYRFWPVEDGYILPDDQYVLYSHGKFNDTPVLIGTASDEAATFMPKKLTVEEFVSQVKNDYGQAAESILKAYPHDDDEDLYRSVKGLRRESTFAWPTWAWAMLQTKTGKNPAYVYVFDYHDETTPDGVGHGLDVPYAFKTLGSPEKPAKDEDLAVSDMYSSYFVNFAETGNPNAEGLPEWPAFKEDKQNVMVIDHESGARPVPNLDKIKAFDDYYKWRRGE